MRFVGCTYKVQGAVHLDGAPKLACDDIHGVSRTRSQRVQQGTELKVVVQVAGVEGGDVGRDVGGDKVLGGNADWDSNVLHATREFPQGNVL